MSKTATFFVTLLGAFAVAAVFQLKHLMRVPETLYAEVAEVIGRGLGLFAIGWGIAGIAYLASGRRLRRETLAWIVGISFVVCASLAKLADFGLPKKYSWANSLTRARANRMIRRFAGASGRILVPSSAAAAGTAPSRLGRCPARLHHVLDHRGRRGRQGARRNAVRQGHDPQHGRQHYRWAIRARGVGGIALLRPHLPAVRLRDRRRDRVLTHAADRAGEQIHRALARVSAVVALIHAGARLRYGGASESWPDIRLLGVLNRIALCYLFTSLLFLNLRLPGLIVAFVAILAGYWALMTFVPVSGIGVGSYAKDANLANWIDAQYLPGRKWNGAWDPEGLLSTLPAIGTCLLGVFAGLLLKEPSLQPHQKTLWLIGAGAAMIALGVLWGLQFPIVKNIWTSSYVLVCGGLSALLLGVFHQVIDAWERRTWATIFIWIGEARSRFISSTASWASSRSQRSSSAETWAALWTAI